MIQLSNVSKTFTGKAGAVQAMKDVNLHVPRGSIYGIVGFSGAGKSTLLRMVNRLETPDQGSVSVDGQDLKELNRTQLRRLRTQIGMVFQQFNLLEAKTVYHNVALPLLLSKTPKEQIQRRVQETLKFVELSEKSETFVSQLSGGQKQRVGIARALITEPKLLLCDEATSALDPYTTVSILNLLKRVNREMGVTILLITHQMQVIQMICDRVAVMEEGRIVEQGSVLEVFGSPQQEITRRFVRTVLNDQIPEVIMDMLRQETRPFQVERLKFAGEAVQQPIIAQLSRLEGLEVNILGATVQEMQESVMCVFLLSLIGSAERIQQAEALVDAAGILRERVEV